MCVCEGDPRENRRLLQKGKIVAGSLERKTELKKTIPSWMFVRVSTPQPLLPLWDLVLPRYEVAPSTVWK